MSDNGRDTRRRRGAPPLPKRVSDLERTQGQNSRDIKKLKDLLNIKDNSAATTKTLIGKDISIRMVSGKEHIGVLRWVDKYNLGVLTSDQLDGDEPSIIPKSNIEIIRPLRQEK